MKQRVVIKIGVLVSVLLFLLGVAWFSFAQLTSIDKGKDVDLFSLVPATCRGVLETDNIDLVAGEFAQAAYAGQLDTLQRGGLWDALQEGVRKYVVDNAHGLSNHINRMVVSFHSKAYSSQESVVYFRLNDSGKAIFKRILQESSIGLAPKTEVYRGKEMSVYAIKDKKFLVAYEGAGFLVLSYQKRLVEEVIDAGLNGTSLKDDELFVKGYRGKELNFVTLYGRTASVPLLSGTHTHCWSEYDLHLNSEVFYLSGEVFEPDSCMQHVTDRLQQVPQIFSDSLVLVSGHHRVDSCISSVIAQSNHSLFDECVSNLSREASYIMVADMDKVLQNPQEYACYLPSFLVDHAELFRSFILSVQVTKLENKLSHILVFTYKE